MRAIASLGRMIARASRAAAALTVLGGAFAVAGAVYESAAEQADDAELKPPGQLFTVAGDRKLHARIAGPRQGPTVVLETGFGGVSEAWTHVQADVAQSAHVVSYDRAGHGFSDPAGEERGASEVAQDLAALLDAMAAPKPYVLVGHSLGGGYARVFAAEHPEDVAAIVLVDSVHEDQVKRSPEIAAAVESSRQIAEWAPLAARIGLVRLSGVVEPLVADLDGAPRRQALSRLVRPSHARGARAELRGWTRSLDAVRAAGPLGDIPLVVVSAEEDPYGVAWTMLQNDLARLSRRSEHVVVRGSTHIGLVTRPEHAAHVARAIRHALALGAEVARERNERRSSL